MSFIYTSMGNLYKRSWGSAYINKGGIDVVGELLSSFHWEYYSVEIICKKKKKGKWNFPQVIPNKIKVWKGWWKKKQLSKTLAVLLGLHMPEPVLVCTVKICTLAFFSHCSLNFTSRYKLYLKEFDHTDMIWQVGYLCTASIKSPSLWYFDVRWKWCTMELFRVSEYSLHGMIWSTRFFFMLAGRFPVLMFSFIMRTLVSFWWEKT